MRIHSTASPALLLQHHSPGAAGEASQIRPEEGFHRPRVLEKEDAIAALKIGGKRGQGEAPPGDLGLKSALSHHAPYPAPWVDTSVCYRSHRRDVMT